MTEDLKKSVETLLKKAASASDSGDAMRFSQAANNAANALLSLMTAEMQKPVAA